MFNLILPNKPNKNGEMAFTLSCKVDSDNSDRSYRKQASSWGPTVLGPRAD